MIEILLFVANENKSRCELNNTDHNAFRKLSVTQSQTEEVKDGLFNSNNLCLNESYVKLLEDLKKRLADDGSLSQEEFLMWSVEDNPLVAPLLELLFEVCHVSLGLKPHCRHHEHEIGKSVKIN